MNEVTFNKKKVKDFFLINVAVIKKQTPELNTREFFVWNYFL